MDCTLTQYIDSKTSILSKITAINNLIDALLLETITSISNSGTATLSMDDGQMKVTTGFRSVSEITSGVVELEKIKQIYVNRYNGRGMVLRGKSNY